MSMTPRLASMTFVCLLASVACNGTGQVLTTIPDSGAASSDAACTGPTCCATNAECIERNGGAPTICRRDHRCAALLSPECQRLFADANDVANDAVVVVGHVAPPDANGDVHGDAIALARKQIHDAAGGLDPATPGGLRRPFVVVSCSTEGPSAIAAAHHLADDVEVPAVVASGSSETVAAMAEQVLVAKHVFSITPTATAARISKIVDDDLVWRLAASELVSVQVLGPLVGGYLEPRARSQGLVTSGTLRVAVVYDGAAAAAELALIQSTLRFNGKSVAENIGDFLAVEIGANAAATIASFAPHLVIHVVPPADPGASIAAIETAWSASSSRPYHVATRDGSTKALESATASDAALRARCFPLGALPVDWSTNDIAAFDIGLRTAFPELAAVPISESAGDAYDALYLVGDAIVAAGAGPLDGTGVASGMHRFAVPGTTIHFGAADAAAAMMALAGGANLDFHGVRGRMLFDDAGDRRHHAIAFCSQSGSFAPSGLRVDAITGTVQGAATCD